MAASGDRLPAVVAHADWSLDPKKRWVARAVHDGGGRYRALAPQRAGELPAFLDGLRREAAQPGALLLGVDFPLGLPRAYARRAGVADFGRLFPRLGSGEWHDFFRVAECEREIGLRRPFYPARPGPRGTVARKHLPERLGLESFGALLRDCDRANVARRAACVLFWTLGPQQVGKAAIVGWRDLLIPALRAGRDLALWPFDGPLEALLAERDMVVAETYPAEIYGHLGLVGPGGRAFGKRRQAARTERGPLLLDHLRRLGARPDPALRQAVLDGFGAAGDGEDPFDAVVGLTGMLNVVLGGRPVGMPGNEESRRIEGWILGQAAAA